MAFGYDDAGRNASVQDARGFATSFTYDEANRADRDELRGWHSHHHHVRPTRSEDLGNGPGGPHHELRIRLEGHLLQVTDALWRVTGYGYDEVGSRVTQTDANTHQTPFDCDRLGRRTRRTLPDGKFETKAYDSRAGSRRGPMSLGARRPSATISATG
jgi:YD repeat-containing protein